MTRLILIRHAEAQGNFERVFHGHTDSDITEKGKAQLEALKQRFKETEYDIIYTSDLRRAMKTAQAINTKKMPVFTDEALREINGGEWENVPFKELLEKYPLEFNQWDKTPHLLQMPNGESLKDFAVRAVNAINKIISENKGKTICVVTHGTVIRVFLGYVYGFSLEDIVKVEWCDNTAISIIDFDENSAPKVIVESDANHLSLDLSTIRNQDWWISRNQRSEVRNQKTKGKSNMIITVTFNPCIDRTLAVNKFKVGSVNRTVSTRIDIGGKGINVSKTLSVLGTKSIVTGFLGSKDKEYYIKALESYDIDADFELFKGHTRVNTKIIDLNDDIQTDINESGVEITGTDKKNLFKKVMNYSKEGNIIVLSGSMPPNFNADDFRSFIISAKEKGAKIVVDSLGENLKSAVENKVFFIKPNLYEFEDFYGKSLKGKEDIADAVKEVVQSGVENVIVSMGGDGAIIGNKDEVYYSKVLNVPVKSTSGAGDSVVAGFLCGVVKGLAFTECARLAFATSNATVETEGTLPAEKAEVDRLYNMVELQKIK